MSDEATEKDRTPAVVREPKTDTANREKPPAPALLAEQAHEAGVYAVARALGQVA